VALDTLTRRIFHELISGHGDPVALTDELIHPHYVDTRGPQGRQAFLGGLMMVREAFPDWHAEVEHLLVGDGEVAVKWTVRGTHRGPFMGLPATGRAIAMAECGFLTFRDGQLLRLDRVADEASLLRQLGVLPPPPTA